MTTPTRRRPLPERRQRGTGSIRPRNDVPGGRLEVRVPLGKVDGKYVYWHQSVRGTTPASWRAARAIARAMQDEKRARRGQPVVKPVRQSLGDWLTTYLDDYADNLAGKTRATYATVFRTYMPADLRALPLADVSTDHIVRWVRTMEGPRGELLSPRTRLNALRYVKRALAVAKEKHRVPTNVAADIKGPKQEHREQARFSVDEAKAFLAAAQTFAAAAGRPPTDAATRRNGPRRQDLTFYFWLALTTGARPSELLALRWSDFDERPTEYTLAGGAKQAVALHVTIARAMGLDRAGERAVGDTKTGVVRRVPLLLAGIGDVMTRHRRAQAERRLRLGTSYRDPEGYVFTTDTGAPLDVTSSPNKQFHKICRAAGLPAIPPYHLRHTCASILHDAGVPVKQIQAWLGHKDVTTTLGYIAARADAPVHTATVLAGALA